MRCLYEGCEQFLMWYPENKCVALICSEGYGDFANGTSIVSGVRGMRRDMARQVVARIKPDIWGIEYHGPIRGSAGPG